ncbi:MAG TPA: penicillin-binding protein [Ignavibacteria bacterium]|nr:penicillin-binding protein [Ignavibacteria bacterium]
MIELKENKRVQYNGRRITLFMILFGAAFAIVAYRLFTIQVIDSAKYQLAAKKQYESKIMLKPSRGIIYDRKMNALVSNVNMYSFAADPNMIDNKDSVAALFASIFEKDKKYYLDKLEAKNTSFVWLERRIDPKYEPLIKDINCYGVIKLNEAHRVFNYDRLASQIIGYTNIDNIGLSGIELEKDNVISGMEGYIVMQKDGLGRKRPAVDYPRREPVDGSSIILTIDMNIQKIVEEELAGGVNMNNSEGGKCIVMSVKTGEILAMHSITINEQGENSDKLAIITDMYEPGSTFKLVSAAASLQEELLNKGDVINTYGGEYTLKGFTVKDAHKFSSLSFQQVIEQSSNIGMVQVANRLGKERFYKYARDFGFGITTGIDLPGEMKGRLKKPVEYSPISLSSMAIGYEVMVTALQMANAYSCLANGGVLMKPYIVKKELSPDGKIIVENKPIPIRTVVSNQTARDLTELLVGVVERGTGTDARIENIRIAGKTGTSRKFVDGKYSETKYTSSFIGYFPAENPEVVIAVIIDAPASGSIYGGKVAAPVFNNIAERIISMTGLHDFSGPDYSQPYNVMTSYSIKNVEEGSNLNLINFDVMDAARLLIDRNIDYEIEGPTKNSVVTKQKFISDEDGKNILMLVTKGKNKDAGTPGEGLKMPGLKGMSLRSCIKVLSSMGIEYNISGCGKVTGQTPEEGVTLGKNQKVSVICSVNEQ